MRHFSRPRNRRETLYPIAVRKNGETKQNDEIAPTTSFKLTQKPEGEPLEKSESDCAKGNANQTLRRGKQYLCAL